MSEAGKQTCWKTSKQVGGQTEGGGKRTEQENRARGKESEKHEEGDMNTTKNPPAASLRADFFTCLQTYKAGQPMSTSGASVATFWPSLTKICFTSPA